MEQTQTCSNCNKPIPISKSATHFGYCRRNIIKCANCGQMYDKNFLEDHEEEFHSTSKCQHCNKMLKNSEIYEHAKNCLMKPRHCEYCDLNVPAKDFNNHFKQCESRTSHCILCEKAIINKEFAIHSATCKGKIKPLPQNIKNSPLNDNKYNFEDSLTQFWQPSSNQRPKKERKVSEKQSPLIKNLLKKEYTTSNTAGKKPVQVKPDFKKPNIDSKEFSKQHFYHNYLNPNPGLSDYAEYDFTDNFGQLNLQDSYDYLPQQSFYGRDAFSYQTPSTFDYVNQESSELDADEQLIQQTLFESSKRNKLDKRQHLPQDFFSEDVMNQSFYKDILDLEKQKAILEDLTKNPKKPAPPKQQPKMAKHIVKAPLKNERRK